MNVVRLGFLSLVLGRFSFFCLCWGKGVKLISMEAI
jgi:hypothetical protein